MEGMASWPEVTMVSGSQRSLKVKISSKKNIFKGSMEVFPLDEEDSPHTKINVCLKF